MEKVFVLILLLTVGVSLALDATSPQSSKETISNNKPTPRMKDNRTHSRHIQRQEYSRKNIKPRARTGVWQGARRDLDQSPIGPGTPTQPLGGIGNMTGPGNTDTLANP